MTGTASVEYDIFEGDDAMKSSLKTLAQEYSIISGTDNFVINNQTVTAASISGADVTFANDTANISIGSADNFVINNQTVTSASISGADVTFDSGTAIISIGSADNFVINNQTVTAASISGADVTFDSGTANISISGADNFTVNGAVAKAMSVSGAASVNITDNVANISIDSGNNFVINNQTVTSASISGADVTFANDTANISIGSGAVTLNGAEVDNITITGAGVVIADGKNATLSIQTGTSQKLNPALTLTPTSIDFADFSPINVTLSTASDGSIGSNNFGNNVAISATDSLNIYQVRPRQQGSGQVQFYVGETFDYFYSSKLLNVSVPQTPPIALFHFNGNTNDEYGRDWTFNSANNAAYADCIFSKGVYKADQTTDLNFSCDDFYIGGKDFTVDFQWEFFAGAAGSAAFQILCDDWQLSFRQGEYLYLTVGQQQFSANIYSAAPNNVFRHIAFVYQHNDQIFKCYANGVKCAEFSTQLSRVSPTYVLGTSNPYINCYFDELRILDGVAAWTADFTPPTQPYTV